MLKEKIRTLRIIGRTYHDKTDGNTYHTTTVFVNGCKLKSDITYGGGDGIQYLLTAIEMIRCAGYDVSKNDGSAFILINCIAKKKEISVARKKDL